MLIKKFGALLLALTLVVACIPGTLATAEDAAWVHVEGETGMGVTQHSPEGFGVSGNCALVGHNHNGQGNYLGASNTITVNIPAAGIYDVFAIVGRGDVNDQGNGRGSYKFSIDDEVFFEKGVGSSSITPISESFMQFSLGMDTYAQRLYWIKAGKLTLPAGEVELKLEVTSHGAIDCLRFVPASWGWEPTGANLDAPTVTKEWVDLEIQEATLSEGDFGNRHPTIEQVKHLFVARADTDGATADWTFDVPLTKSYDVWVLCDDYTNNAESQRYLKINQDDQITIPASGIQQFTSFIASGWPGMGYPNYTFNMQWIKVTTKEFTAGQVNTMRWSCGIRTSNNDINLTAIRCVRLIPSEWVWSPAANTMGEYDVALTAAEDKRVTPDENGIIHLEAESGILNANMKTEANTSASNGTYAVVSGTGTVGKPGSSTLGFKLEEAGMYDVWAAVATHQATGAHIGGLIFTLDNETIYTRSNGGVDRRNPALYTVASLYDGSLADFNGTIRWVKLASMNIDAGGHTLVAATRESMSNGHTTGLIDCVRLVPVGNTFSVESFDDTLTFSNPDWHNLETEGGILSGHRGIEAVGTDTYAYKADQGVASGNMSSVSSFYAKGGKYDVWALVALEDREAQTRLGAYTVYLNGTLLSLKSNNRANVEWNPLYTVPGSHSVASIPMGMHWVKFAGGIDIEEGGNIIDARVEPSTNTVGAIDKVIVVPTSWNYVPTTTTAAPVAPEVVYDFTLTGDVAASATLTATANIKKTVDAEKTAVVIVAVYKNDTLVRVVPSAVTTLTATTQTISAPVTLPADVTGVTVSAFLWDGLAAGNAYCLPITK